MGMDNQQISISDQIDKLLEPAFNQQVSLSGKIDKLTDSAFIAGAVAALTLSGVRSENLRMGIANDLLKEYHRLGQEVADKQEIA